MGSSTSIPAAPDLAASICRSASLASTFAKRLGSPNSFNSTHTNPRPPPVACWLTSGLRSWEPREADAGEIAHRQPIRLQRKKGWPPTKPRSRQALAGKEVGRGKGRGGSNEGSGSDPGSQGSLFDNRGNDGARGGAV